MASTLNIIEPFDIGRRLRLTTARGIVEGDLGDFSVETDWITTATIAGGNQRVPSRRTMILEVGDWTGRLPLDTVVEWL